MSPDTLLQARDQTLHRSIERAEVLVTTGAGGVGKTTTAAAIGLASAKAGRKTLVMTIDPAKRLAQALGLDSLGADPQKVPHDLGGGELWAMMLDMQSTFDEVIDEHATSPETARAIRDNPIYKTLSSTLSGTQEYMAMEKLHALHESGEWDLLVIDTPPTRSALDFLEAPKHMTSFLEGRLLKVITKPAKSVGKGGLRFLGAGANAFMKVAGKVTGMDLLTDLGEFFAHFEGMYDGFKQRADEVLELLEQPTSQFVVVTSPQPPPLREAKFFVDRLEQEGLHLAGVVVNRIHLLPELDQTDEELRKVADRLAESSGQDQEAVADGMRLLADLRGIAGRERRDVDAALFGRNINALVDVPLLRSDVHDLAGLGEIAQTLTREPAGR